MNECCGGLIEQPSQVHTFEYQYIYQSLGGAGLAGVGVDLLEEVCYWGWAVSVQKPMPGPVFLALMLAAMPPAMMIMN